MVAVGGTAQGHLQVVGTLMEGGSTGLGQDGAQLLPSLPVALLLTPLSFCYKTVCL